jgi:aminopeptidase N
MPRCHRLVTGLVLALVAGLLAAQPPAAPTGTEPLRTAGDRPIDIRHIRLDLKVDLPKKTVEAQATIGFQALRPLTNVALDAVGFTVHKVEVTGAAGQWRHSHDGKTLLLEYTDPKPLPTGTAGEIVVTYTVREPKNGLFFFGPTPNEPDTPLTVWSQGQSIANRHWFPCLDHPDQRQTTELVVTVADGFEVLSNGRLVERRKNSDGTATFHWSQEQPHVSYLVTLVVGKFDIVREDWHGREVSYYVPVGRKGDVARSFGRTRDMLDFFSERFGIDYPWNKYAQVVAEQFTMGGMENTTATTLNDYVLLDERSAIDRSTEDLISHELAHQWWGDLVTCRDWAHIWLNEGFATFAEVLWEEHAHGSEAGEYMLWQKARTAIAGGRERPVVDRHYPNPDAMFDSRAYPKGGWVLHMLRRQLGDELFWKAVRTYGTEHRLRSVETADFRRTLERESGRNLERFFYDFTERPGSPVIQVTTDYLADQKLAKVSLKQMQPGEPFALRVPVALSVAGRAEPLVLEVPVVDRNEVTTFVPLPAKPPLVVVDPAYSILGEIKEEKSRDLWLAQLREAGVAARLRAVAHFSASTETADREALAQALAEEKFYGVQVEIAQALGSKSDQTGRDALLAGARHADPKVRAACVENLLLSSREEPVVTALRAILQQGDPSAKVEAAALRAYARSRQPDVTAVLLPWLAKESQSETLRVAAFDGLARNRDLTALDAILAWTKKGKPRAARVAALRSATDLATSALATDGHRRQAAAAAAACLVNEAPFVRRAAVEALRQIGRPALPFADALESVAENDSDTRLSERAKAALAEVRKAPDPATESARLREEVERLKRANDALQERLDRLEKAKQK